MTPRQITLIQSSWSAVHPLAQQAGELFYKRLFASEPLVRHLFKTDVQEQACKFAAMLNHIVQHLAKADELNEDIRRLGHRHNGYGAQPEHYAVVGECLLTTLAEGLGEAWTDELKAAWTALFNWLSGNMISGQGNYSLCGH